MIDLNLGRKDYREIHENNDYLNGENNNSSFIGKEFSRSDDSFFKKSVPTGQSQTREAIKKKLSSRNSRVGSISGSMKRIGDPSMKSGSLSSK